jgi:NitT/TauT family transport system permease protein
MFSAVVTRVSSGAIGTLRRALPFALLLAAWSTAALIVDPFLLPPPWTVLRATLGFVTGVGWRGSLHEGRFVVHAAATAGRVAIGFAVASSAGIAAGMASARMTRVERIVDPLVHLVRSVPGIAWLPVAMVWFGIGTVTSVFLIAVAAFFPAYVATFHGVRQLPTEWLRVARILGASDREVLTRVVLPGALPAITAGLRLSLGIAWAYVVLGELTGVNRGLGAVIMDARMMGDVTTVLVGVVCIALLGWASDLALRILLHRWGGAPA